MLVIGGGVAGCNVARILADRGVDVTLVEKSEDIGGRVRSYGCKAFDKCLNCGVCLTASMWDKILKHPKVRIITKSEVKDITGAPGEFAAVIESAGVKHRLDGIEAIVVSTGFESLSSGISSHLHIEVTAGNTDPDTAHYGITQFDRQLPAGLITGTQLEEIVLKRTGTAIFESAPRSVAFIQCLGSRDKNEGGLYCSRVCCSYSTRAAKLIRNYYPQCDIVFFYMELQNVESGDYYSGLLDMGMEFIKCRPSKIVCGETAVIEYDDPGSGIKSKQFDLVVLSDGVHAGADNDRLAEICILDQNEDGFLKAVCSDSGIFVAGCARAPMKIDEAYADSVSVAGSILSMLMQKN